MIHLDLNKQEELLALIVACDFKANRISIADTVEHSRSLEIYFEDKENPAENLLKAVKVELDRHDLNDCADKCNKWGFDFDEGDSWDYYKYGADNFEKQELLAFIQSKLYYQVRNGNQLKERKAA